MATEARRETAKQTFNQVAALYDEARPGYPEAVYDDLAALSGLQPAARLLEIGSGTGHATLPLAQRGFHIDCIELGEQMAEVARVKLAPFPNVTITVSDFDNWAGNSLYDLAFSASAYHWLNPATRVPRIAQRLKPGGHIATIRNFHVQGKASAARNEATNRIYAEIFPQRATKSLPQTEEIAAEDAREWQSSGLFRNAQTRIYHWQSQLTAEEYVQMLNTHSDHRLMPAEARERLFARLTQMLNTGFQGLAIKEYATLLQIAEKIA